MMAGMKRVSVAHTKGRVSDARRRKPPAPAVPMSREEALAVFESFADVGDLTFDAVAEVKAGRR
jgi:hypothetical protein